MKYCQYWHAGAGLFQWSVSSVRSDQAIAYTGSAESFIILYCGEAYTFTCTYTCTCTCTCTSCQKLKGERVLSAKNRSLNFSCILLETRQNNGCQLVVLCSSLAILFTFVVLQNCDLIKYLILYPQGQCAAKQPLTNKTNYWQIVAHRLSLFSLLSHLHSIECNGTY